MKIVVIVAIMILLVAGCIGQKTSEVKEIGMQEIRNETTNGTLSSQVDENKTSGLGLQIRDAIAEALEKSNRSSDL